jgi:PAS domain S-box-containing protein
MRKRSRATRGRPATAPLASRLDAALAALDLSAASAADRRAREADERLHRFLDDIGRALPMFFFVKNAADLTFEYWSPRMGEFSGVSSDEIVGTPGGAFFPDRHMALYQQRDREVLGTQNLVSADEPVMTRRGERWIHTQKVPILYVEGRPSYVLGICEEITDRVRAEAERGRVLDEITRAVAERDRTLAAVAHDLGTPLSVLSLTASALRALPPGSGAETLARFADRIARAARQMTAVASDLRNEGLLRRGKLLLDRRAHDPGALIDEAVELDRALADSRGVLLDADVAAGLAPVWCDVGAIARVLANLVGNAVEFTPAGGRVTLRAGAAGAAVRFEVSNTGPGIAPGDLPRLFEPYFQAAAAKRRGTGLGLAIAKGIVEAHGGSIGVESALGRGATFHFTLPCVGP